MRRLVAALGIAGLMLAFAQPAAAQAPAAMSIFEGGGRVCTEADQGLWNGFWKSKSTIGNTTKCSFYRDAFWSGSLATANDAQGLYAPTLGPPASKGGFTFTAGPDLEPPASYCVSTDGGAGCSILSAGELRPSSVAGTGQPGLGVYAGSSLGRGYSETTSVTGNTVKASFGWDQSAATILPIIGTTSTGGTIAGFTSSRSGPGSEGSAGVQDHDDPTTIFRVEGVFIFLG